MMTVLLTVILVGCGNWQEKLVESTKRANSRSKFNNLEKELNLLDESGSSLVSRAKSSIGKHSACAEYSRFLKYKDLLRRFDEKIFLFDKDILPRIKNSLDISKNKTAWAAYEQMTAGLEFNCIDENQNRVSGVYAIEVFADLMGGAPNNNLDPKIVRTAFIREAKAEAKLLMNGWNKDKQADSSEHRQVFLSLLQKVSKWELDPRELGITLKEVDKIYRRKTE